MSTQEISELFKRTIRDAGYELRVLHASEPFTYAVVRSFEISKDLVAQYANGVLPPNETTFDPDWMLGHGNTEEEAWQMTEDAWKSLQSEKKI
jgi:hypothetical protein